MRIDLQASLSRWALGAAAALLVLIFFVIVPPIAQDEAYHMFADSRTLCDIPNFWNVISNLPFAAVGILGLWKLRGLADRVLFTGVLLTFFGSAYYHLAPSDARLVWDRLPMTITFMSLLACVLFYDQATFAALPVSGHTIKHALAAIAAFFIFRWRQAVASEVREVSVLCETEAGL
jgi:hypothetical protein